MDRIEEIRERERNVREYGISGINTAIAVHDYYLEDIPYLLSELAARDVYIAELERAKDEGRVFVYPCTVGATVYEVFDTEIYDYEVSCFTDDGGDKLIVFDGEEHLLAAVWGKTVFATRAEAEAALAAMEG